uniref:Uncharacterized protein n=1 Tax=Anopheles minimus TaxID=112268 RepID=A0A182WNY8_9DIPT
MILVFWCRFRRQNTHAHQFIKQWAEIRV